MRDFVGVGQRSSRGGVPGRRCLVTALFDMQVWDTPPIFEADVGIRITAGM